MLKAEPRRRSRETCKRSWLIVGNNKWRSSLFDILAQPLGIYLPSHSAAHFLGEFLAPPAFEYLVIVEWNAIDKANTLTTVVHEGFSN